MAYSRNVIKYRFLLFTLNSIILITFVTASSVDLIGCGQFNYTKSQCFVEDVEVFPYLHISESGIQQGIKTVQDCQKKCREFVDCHYFTFRKEKSTGKTTCHLKPAPGYDFSPVMFMRKYKSDALYTYTSGPADCTQKCTEETELTQGCGPSSPGSCSRLPNGQKSMFNAFCSANRPEWVPGSCGQYGYKCCVGCQSGSCCKRLKGKVLSDSKNSKGLSSKAFGISSADHCQALCIRTKTCTHWNFITSSSTAFIGGACYLKTYHPINAPDIVDAPNGIQSIIGSVDCNSDYGLNDNNESSSQRIKKIFSKDGEETCYISGLQLNNTLASTVLPTRSITDCHSLCRKTPACHFFQLDRFNCNLKYSDEGITHIDDTSILFGMRSCTFARIENGCFEVGIKYIGDTFPQNLDGGEEFSEPSLDALKCSDNCKRNKQCVGWTQRDTSCFQFTNIRSKQRDNRAISGNHTCVVSVPELEQRQS